MVIRRENRSFDLRTKLKITGKWMRQNNFIPYRYDESYEHVADLHGKRTIN